MIDSKSHIFQNGLVPLKMTCSRNGIDEVLWENGAPNEVRPLYLIREEETEADLLSEVVPSTDKIRKELNEEGIVIKYDEGKLVDIAVNKQDTMKGLKFQRCISGLQGADCIICTTKVYDWTTRAKVISGFPINRNADDTWELYNQLVSQDGEIPRRPDDLRNYEKD